MKRIYLLLLIFCLVACGKKSEVTWDTALYSDPDLTNKLIDVKKGTVGIAAEYKNHAWNTKHSIKMIIDGKEGYISPKYVVIGQDPEKSVYKSGYKTNYKYFYDPKDKKHYRDGYVYPSLDKLPKDKINID